MTYEELSRYWNQRFAEAKVELDEARAALAERDAAYRDLAAEHEARMAESDATIAQLRAEWDKADAALVAAVRRIGELRGELRCWFTRNRCGTDTWSEPCRCSACRIYAATGAGEGE